MNQNLALNTLSLIMGWTDEQAREEFEWLRLMARLKYDGYRDFQAGVRFVESLATWLQQFDRSARPVAYDFIRQGLVYIGPAETQKLIDQFFPLTVRDRLVRSAATQHGLAPYQVYANAGAINTVESLRRKTLFLGLSDGARIDAIRHANAGILSNEQMVMTPQLDLEKWKDLLNELRSETQDDSAKFKLAYLIDDFMGTGTSFLRFKSEKNEWGGKLARFQNSLTAVKQDMGDDFPFEPGWELCIHHYIATKKAEDDLTARLQQYQGAAAGPLMPAAIHLSFGTVMPENFPIDSKGTRFEDFIRLTTNHYDPKIQSRHTGVGGTEHLGLGYGGCALPLILDHNTPNNSVALLWAETEGGPTDQAEIPTPAMRPLFRRRQRHV